MKKLKLGMLLIMVVLVALGIISWKRSLPIFDDQFNAELLEQQQIAPLEKAITLAMTKSSESLLVIGASKDAVKAINLNRVFNQKFADSVDAYQQISEQRLREIATTHPSSEYAWDLLDIPYNALPKQVAAGTNYSAHAQEVGHEGEPFLFPKLSLPTAWNAAVNKGPRLDHEVELCALPLKDYRKNQKPQLGYLLCGDFTNRWLLVKHIELGGVMGLTGFPEGKGGATRLPVGPLLVIPSDDDFYKEFELGLYVNDQLRQRSSTKKMIWSPEKALAMALEHCSKPYRLHGEDIQLLDDCSVVPARTLILTGTPEGVMFSILTMWNSAFYLQRNDQVISVGTYLGYTNNRIH